MATSGAAAPAPAGGDYCVGSLCCSSHRHLSARSSAAAPALSGGRVGDLAALPAGSAVEPARAGVPRCFTRPAFVVVAWCLGAGGGWCHWLFWPSSRPGSGAAPRTGPGGRCAVHSRRYRRGRRLRTGRASARPRRGACRPRPRRCPRSWSPSVPRSAPPSGSWRPIFIFFFVSCLCSCRVHRAPWL